jgi:hypothetical protein
MALVLARFLFGFSLSWIVAALLIAATLLCIRLVGIAVVAFHDERTGNVVGAFSVAAVVIAALGGMYFLGNHVHDALGASALVQGLPNWLAGSNTLSAAAIFGALSGGALLAGIPAWLNRAPAPPREEQKTDKAKEAAREKPAKAAPAKKSKAAAGAAASKKSAAAPKGARIPELGWIALFLLLLGAALFAFAFGVDPLWPPQNASAAAIKHFQDMAGRAHPVYLAASALLGGGALFALIWLLWRRRP